jgi:DNA-binding response OmpR family regulator
VGNVRDRENRHVRVLIVEDDRRLADVVREDLEECGHVADIVGDGATALQAAASTAYDVLLLDVMLGPGLDGYELCALLRERGVASGVIMLTALDAVNDRVRGLRAGADDYIVKPFALSELAARIDAVTRRQSMQRATPLELRGIRLEPMARRASASGRALELTRKEFDLLELLMSNAGIALSKDRVLEHVWGFDAPGDPNLVEVHMARLRRKIAMAGGDDCIATIRNVGYRFERDARPNLATATP